MICKDAFTDLMDELCERFVGLQGWYGSHQRSFRSRPSCLQEPGHWSADPLYPGPDGGTGPQYRTEEEEEAVSLPRRRTSQTAELLVFRSFYSFYCSYFILDNCHVAFLFCLFVFIHTDIFSLLASCP